MIAPAETAVLWTILQSFSARVCLLAITLAGSRLQRPPNLVCCVDPALRAGSTQQTKLFARRSRASPRQKKARTLIRICVQRHNLLSSELATETSAKLYIGTQIRMRIRQTHKKERYSLQKRREATPPAASEEMNFVNRCSGRLVR